MNDIVNTWIFKINEYIVNFSSFFPLRFMISPLHTHPFFHNFASISFSHYIYIYIIIIIVIIIKY